MIGETLQRTAAYHPATVEIPQNSLILAPLRIPFKHRAMLLGCGIVQSNI